MPNQKPTTDDGQHERDENARKILLAVHAALIFAGRIQHTAQEAFELAEEFQAEAKARGLDLVDLLNSHE